MSHCRQFSVMFLSILHDMKVCKGLYCLSLSLAFSPFASAADVSGADGAGLAELITLVLGLAFVLLVILGAAWGIKRLGVVPSANKGVIRILSVTPVGSRERIALVEVGEQQLLLGVTASQITLLHRFTDPISTEQNNPTNSEFAQKLHQLIKRS